MAAAMLKHSRESDAGFEGLKPATQRTSRSSGRLVSDAVFAQRTHSQTLQLVSFPERR